MAMLVQLVDGVGSTKFPLAKPVFTIGRAPDNDLYIEDGLVSGHHAVIEREAGPESDAPDRHVLRDLDSTNRSFVNDVPVTRQPLKHQDVLRFGLHSFLFIDESALDIERTKKIKKSWIPGVYYTKD